MLCVHKGKKRMLNLLELEIKVVVGNLVVLETKPGYPERVANTLAAEPSPQQLYLLSLPVSVTIWWSEDNIQESFYPNTTFVLRTCLRSSCLAANASAC